MVGPVPGTGGVWPVHRERTLVGCGHCRQQCPEIHTREWSRLAFHAADWASVAEASAGSDAEAAATDTDSSTETETGSTEQEPAQPEGEE